MVKAREEVTIEIEPDSELAKALAATGNKTVILMSNGERFVVSRDGDEDIWANYEPERVREALQAAPGIFTSEEAEKLKQDIYRWREEGTRPIDRP